MPWEIFREDYLNSIQVSFGPLQILDYNYNTINCTSFPLELLEKENFKFGAEFLQSRCDVTWKAYRPMNESPFWSFQLKSNAGFAMGQMCVRHRTKLERNHYNLLIYCGRLVVSVIKRTELRRNGQDNEIFE